MTEAALSHGAIAVILGTAFGAGLLLLLPLVPRWGAPSLTRRIAPYLRDVTDPNGTTPAFVSAGEASRLKANENNKSKM